MFWFAFSMTNRMRLCWLAFAYQVQPVFLSDSSATMYSFLSFLRSLWLPLTFRGARAMKWKSSKANNDMFRFSHVITFNDLSAVATLGDRGVHTPHNQWCVFSHFIKIYKFHPLFTFLFVFLATPRLWPLWIYASCFSRTGRPCLVILIYTVAVH